MFSEFRVARLSGSYTVAIPSDEYINPTDTDRHLILLAS